MERVRAGQEVARDRSLPHPYLRGKEVSMLTYRNVVLAIRLALLFAVAAGLIDSSSVAFADDGGGY
jgi:hypothetical protein